MPVAVLRSLGRREKAAMALLVVLPLTVFAFTLGSTSVPQLVGTGRTLRWAMLFLLAGVAFAFGRRSDRQLRPLVVATGGLGAVGLLSATWSVTPRTTAERAVSFLVLVVVTSFVGRGALRSRERLELVLAALLVGPLLVALGGLVLLVADHSVAVQPASTQTPERLRGLGENPNTVAMLFALVLPVALWFCTDRRSRLVWIAAAGVAVLLYGSILASGSRGAMFAAAAGVLSFILIRVRPLRLLVPTTGLAAAFLAVSMSVASGRPPQPATTQQTALMAEPAPVTTSTTSPSGSKSPPLAPAPARPRPAVKTPPAGAAGQAGGAPAVAPAGARPPERPAPTPRRTTPLPTTTSTTTTAPATTRAPTIGSLGGRFRVELLPPAAVQHVPTPFPPEADEIGYPGLYQYKPILAYGSGRIYVWLTAVAQGLQRPILGYGFGTEQAVFTDRSYIFAGTFSENSFVGIFLTLGLVGVLLLAAPFVAVGRIVLRTLRAPELAQREVVAVGAATAAAGFVVAFFQSYLYSVGNVATATFWIVVALAVTAGTQVVQRPAAAR